ncbi:MAG TPA: ABC transporter permease [Phototrophicaceae bacterium]|nr:ABC transporter permease [Phototrophicaceae bacterium]
MNVGYILQRLLLALVVILGVTFVVFMIVHIVPGDPARVILGAYASNAAVAEIHQRLGLDAPFLQQYFTWLGNALQGNLGSSLITSQPVGPQLIQRLGPTLELTIASLLVGIVIAFPVGILSAVKPGSALDIIASFISQIGVSIPSFWMGILLILFFSLTLGWLPPSGYTPMSQDLGSWLAHLVLPAVTSGIVSASILTRFIRSAMLNVLGMNYIQTARSKGLTERSVTIRHGLRNALISIVTIIGLQVTALMSGVVIVEIVFAWPGLGRLALDAVLDRDYPLLQGAVLTVAVVVTLVNLVVDFLYFFLDPRIEYA